ncbi:MAG: hypothetical protein KME64_15435 [Scytonematopsis contorta HA4267-MV1]|jgi:hypothetical protein|nr:hypothetical protein [Scytonematopsis contorta HA4267-MV1]
MNFESQIVFKSVPKTIRSHFSSDEPKQERSSRVFRLQPDCWKDIQARLAMFEST